MLIYRVYQKLDLTSVWIFDCRLSLKNLSLFHHLVLRQIALGSAGETINANRYMKDPTWEASQQYCLACENQQPNYSTYNLKREERISGSLICLEFLSRLNQACSHKSDLTQLPSRLKSF